MNPLRQVTKDILQEGEQLSIGGGIEGINRQIKLGRMTVRERLSHLIDQENGTQNFFEIGLFAAWGMYKETGGVPQAGVVAGIAKVSGRSVMIIANDATVKAGAMFPQSVKKMLRAQRIAFESRLPIIYLVDSAGVFLPLQEDIFPDEDDFGRIFRNNAVISAAGIPQFAAIMGNCVAGGGYLPVLCDKLLMTEGSGLYLAGPALVKAAIGQEVDAEALGGAKMHAEISGTVDFYEKDDLACLKRLRALAEFLPSDSCLPYVEIAPERSVDEIYEIAEGDRNRCYDVKDLIACIVDKDSLQEYKKDYGKHLVTAYAKIKGICVGIVANQRVMTTNGARQMEVGGVIYKEGADKAARFIMDCNQIKVPLLFLQDVVGFMVGLQAEQSGIIRSGAKLVSAVSNSIVPKITVIIGNSFGAGHYALCGKAYDPSFILAWPNAKYAVMGASQAADTLVSIKKKAREKAGVALDSASIKEMHEEIKCNYLEQMDIRYGAARGWVDAIIAPETTRDVLAHLFGIAMRAPLQERSFHTGVIQV